MKKIALFIVALFVFGNAAEAQQIHQLSQYMLNDFAFNPAVAGKSHDLITKINYRKQWAGNGFEGDAPSTFALSGHTNLTQSKSVGLGMMIFSDVTGPTRRGGVSLAYAYHLPLGKTEADDKNLSFGLGVSVLRQSINFDDLRAANPNDVVLGTGTQSKLGLDMNFGTYYYEENWFAGFSINQLLGNGVKLVDADIENKTIEFDRHFYLTGGYTFEINEDFDVEPIFLMKAVKAAPVQFDISARAIYQDKYWLGATYRTQDALSILMGMRLNNNFNLAYSYDITTSAVRQVSSGSHEITIGYDIRWHSDNYYKKLEDKFDY